MKKWMTYGIALALTFALWGSRDAQAQDTNAAVFVDENGDGIDDNARKRHRRGHRGIFGRGGASPFQKVLTEAQREELKALVDGLKESDASREDIHAAVKAKFEAWGVEFPERSPFSSRLASALSEDQQAELTALINGLRESDASRADIRAAVDAQLETWGVERPERGLDAVLTEDQEAELKALVNGLRESDASKEDIRTAVNEQLEAWGVERPERSHRRMGARGHFGRRGGIKGFRGPAPAGETAGS